MNPKAVGIFNALFAALCASHSALAQQEPACFIVDRSNLTQCALSANLAVKAEDQELDAARGREQSVSPVLPSNPLLSLSAARRTSGAADANNWYVTLQQELEIAGQRGVRRDAAAAAVRAQSQRVVVARQEAVARAWVLFFDTLASTEERRLAARQVQMSARVSEVAQARADQGVGSPVDADLAAAAGVGAVTAELEAERRLQQARAALASLLGTAEPAGSTITVEGDLRPLDGISEALVRHSAESLSQRAEILAAKAEARAQERQADAYRRSRIPNPTLSVFAQNDGLNERVFGAGIAFPIPIPGNVGHTYVGEIAEADALARKARITAEQIRRSIQLEIATATVDFEAAAKTVEAFPNEKIARAEETLEALAAEAEAGRLAIREAIVAQQALIDFLRAHVNARRDWCMASVALSRALGLPVDGNLR